MVTMQLTCLTCFYFLGQSPRCQSEQWCDQKTFIWSSEVKGGGLGLRVCLGSTGFLAPIPLAHISSLFIAIIHGLRADKLRRANALAQCGRPVISISFRLLIGPRET